MPKLKQHSVIQKSYQCQYCKVKCRRPQDLRRHLLVHAEASFECDLCGNKFTRFDTLRRHKRDNCRNAQSVYQTRIAARQAEQKVLDARSRHQNESLQITQVYPYGDMSRPRTRERTVAPTASTSTTIPSSIPATKTPGLYTAAANSALETPYISPSLTDANIYNQQSFSSGCTTAAHLQTPVKVPFYSHGPLYIPSSHQAATSPSNHLNEQHLCPPPPPPYPSSYMPSSMVHAPHQLAPNALMDYQHGSMSQHASEFLPNGVVIERLVSPPQATYQTPNPQPGEDNSPPPPPSIMAHYGQIIHHDSTGAPPPSGPMPSITSILNFRVPQTHSPVIMGNDCSTIQSIGPAEQKENEKKSENSENGKEYFGQFEKKQIVKQISNNLQRQSTKKLGLEPIEPKTEHINHKRSPCRFDEYTR